MTYHTAAADILVATGSGHVVVGARGPYVEFRRDQMVMGNLTQVVGLCPHHNQRHKYFHEWRALDNTMIYEQRQTVSYANYRIGYFYAAPSDLIIRGHGAAQGTHFRLVTVL
jgi:hypothetical protein